MSRNTIQKINETKAGSLKKFNSINGPLTGLIKKKKTRVARIRNEGGNIITNLSWVQRIIKEYYEQLYADQSDNLGEVDKFLERCKLLKLTWEKENLNQLTRDWISKQKTTHTQKKAQAQMTLLWNLPNI